MTIARAISSALILHVAVIAGASAQEDQRSYGYVRTLEGSAMLISADTGAANPAALNYPVLSGDRLIVDGDSLVEVVLSDFNILRVDSNTEIIFERLAFSADAEDRVTTLRLESGGVQMVVTEHALGDELPSLVLSNTTVFLHDPGTYRISSWDGLSRVTVRSGYAEASTERGSAIARADEEIKIDGQGWPAVAVLRAGPLDELELWGEYLMASADPDSAGRVDPALAYSASALEENGEWLEIEGEAAWSPYVEESWRPYTRGTWATTPSGMSWVGYDSWGWVTGHYGSWTLHSRYGWLWYPGVAFAPAWVYWYWGPTYVGWVPSGYYHGRHGIGFTFGYLGFSSGYWSNYNYWTFCPPSYFATPYGNDYYYAGSEMPARTGRTAVPRGAIVTDTSVVARVGWTDNEKVVEALASDTRARGRRHDTDVTSFVAGRGNLSEEVRAAVRSGRKNAIAVRSESPERFGSEGRSSLRVGVRAGVQDAPMRRSYLTRESRSTAASRFGEASVGSASGDGSRLSGISDQGWRSRSSTRRSYTVERPEVIERRQSATRSTLGSPNRVQDAWRISRPSSSFGSGSPGAQSDSSHRRYGTSVGSSSSSPARRVVEGITSTGRSSSGSARSGAVSRSGSSRGSVGSRSGTSSRSSSARSGSTGSSSRGRSSVSRSSGTRSTSGRTSSGSRSSSRSSKSSGKSTKSRPTKSDG